MISASIESSSNLPHWICLCLFVCFRSSEGKTVEVPYRGNVHDTIKNILGGVRSTCTYVGASKLKELSKRTTFIRVTMQLNTIFSWTCFSYVQDFLSFYYCYYASFFLFLFGRGRGELFMKLKVGQLLLSFWGVLSLIG